MTIHRALRLALVLVPAIIALTQRAMAQAAVNGTRVRVVDVLSNTPVMTGMLVRQVGDSVTILSGNPSSPTPYTVWGIGNQRRLEVRTGLRRQTTAGALLGAVIGAAAGAAIGSAAYRPCVAQPGLFGGLHCMFTIDQAGATALGAGGGILAGSLIGALVGHAFTSETWSVSEHSPVRVAIAPGSRGLFLSASVAF